MNQKSRCLRTCKKKIFELKWKSLSERNIAKEVGISRRQVRNIILGHGSDQTKPRTKPRTSGSLVRTNGPDQRTMTKTHFTKAFPWLVVLLVVVG